MRPALIAAFACAVVCTIPACGGTAPPNQTAVVTLGTAALDGSGFEPLEGDQPLISGAQGGFHVWLKYRVAGVPSGKIEVKRTVRRRSDQALILTTQGAQQIGPPSPAGYWELPNAVPSFMCPTPIGVQVRDEAVLFDLIISDANGRLLGEAKAEATPRCSVGQTADWCAKICSG